MKQTTITSLLIFCLVLSPAILLAQRTVTGKVSDSESGEGLAGVQIQAVGAAAGTFTNETGDYSLQVPDNATALRFKYFGYADQEITLGAENSINISLVQGTFLDEVMVIGYGEVKKEDATGAIQSVSSEDFNRGAITSPQELLSGKIAGVQITTGGAPGDGSAIRIRGGSSLRATNDPLIVIDGVPVANDGVSGTRNPLNIVNPNDIETFTVLKDASATAIYGSRASNGVILITTKRGKLGKKLGVQYNGNYGISNRIGQLDVLSADEFRTLIETQFEEGHPARELLGTENTDWQDQIYQQAAATDHNLSFSGGVANIPYRISLGYTNKQGILKTDLFSRSSASVNLSPSFLDNTLQVKVNFKYMNIRNQFANRGAIGSAVAFDPTKPVFDSDSPYGGYYTWTQLNGNPQTLAPANPLALLELRDDRSQVSRFITNAQIDYRFPFLPEMRANLNLATDRSRSDGTVDVPDFASWAFVNGGEDAEYYEDKQNDLLEFYLNYVNEFGASKLDVMGGYSWQRFYKDNYNESFNISRSDTFFLPDDNPKEYYLISLFGRLNYSWNDKLLFTATLRRDGTSRFDVDNRWGLFPAAALAYKIVNDENSQLSNLKIRLGYGVTGQQDLGEDYYPYLARYLNSFGNAQYQFGNEFYSTLRPNGYDANLKWEETTTYNIGLDYGFLKNRIYGSVEYYIRQTKDLLNEVPVPAGTNLTNFIVTNVGDLENRGVEISINTVPLQSEKMRWELGGNVTMNQNKITRLTATDDSTYLGVFTGGIAGGVGNTIQIHSVGFPANTFFVYEQVYDDNGVPIEGLYVDRNDDGIITPDDRYHYENPASDVFFGFFSSFQYQNFEFLFAGRASIGNHMYNNVESDQAFYNRLYNSVGVINNVHTSISDHDFSVPQYFSDHFIVDASYLRLDHITLGYNFSDMIEQANLLKLSVVLQNPVLITNYRGLDPEIFNGIDGNIYPRSRTILVALNASF